ncbi:hypothetical protein VO54_01490 [Elizabethkingia miricola]|nr:hypothetical protein VO54_01490 [Elizabethkingia miricola]
MQQKLNSSKDIVEKLLSLLLNKGDIYLISEQAKQYLNSEYNILFFTLK